MEKSWKKILALHAFHPILTHHLGYYTVTFITFIMSVVCGYKEVQGDNTQRTIVFLSVLKLVIVDHGKMMHESWKIMEKSWNLILGKRWEPCLMLQMFKEFDLCFTNVKLQFFLNTCKSFGQ